MADTDSAPALKHMLSAERFRQLAAEARALDPRFDERAFLGHALSALDDLSLMERVRRMAEALEVGLPTGDFARRADAVVALAPRAGHAFVAIALADWVALHGLSQPAVALAALKRITRFGSSEFAVRPFLRADLPGTLALMAAWPEDEDEHVRRLASEGTRPRLPWSFRLEALVKDPRPVLPILDRLNADPSLYVRKSVANHLNDISKDHPILAMDVAERWDRSHTHTGWIAGRALRTLVKAGDPRALSLLGARGGDGVAIDAFTVTPARLRLGERIALAATLRSTAAETERLVVDYAIRYARPAGRISRKVFKGTVLTLAPGATATFARAQEIRDFSTRRHHAGSHGVELLVNGRLAAEAAFELETE